MEVVDLDFYRMTYRQTEGFVESVNLIPVKGTKLLEQLPGYFLKRRESAMLGVLTAVLLKTHVF